MSESKESRFIYHYYGFIRQDDKTIHLDGILTCHNPIITMDDYRQAKMVIVEGEVMNARDFVLTNLSLLSKAMSGRVP